MIPLLLQVVTIILLKVQLFLHFHHLQATKRVRLQGQNTQILKGKMKSTNMSRVTDQTTSSVYTLDS